MSSLCTDRRALAFLLFHNEENIKGGRIVMPDEEAFTIKEEHVIFADGILMPNGSKLKIDVPIHQYLQSVIYSLTVRHLCENL